MLPATIPSHDGTSLFVFRKDEEREARYLPRMWRKDDEGFYIDVNPPRWVKVEWTVRT